MQISFNTVDRDLIFARTDASVVFTVGHSTRTLADFAALLQQNHVATLADVRRHPGSRRHPHFSRENLQSAVERLGVDYLHLPELGGRRSPAPDSPNTAWRNPQFRGYADHMATAEFQSGIDRLLEARRPAAVMCAEAVPWRCHRQMIADELMRRGYAVFHILGRGSVERHQVNVRATDRGTHLIYP